MRTRNKLFVLVSVILIAAFAAGMALADDGQLFRRNISKTPDQESEKAAISMMRFYVPAQAADGTLLEGIDYYDAEGALVDTRQYAKPLISTYIDEMAHEDPGSELMAYATAGGVAFANFDAHAALSLDDGATWKNYNLSRSADLSSFVLHDGLPYPGSVFQMVHAVAGKRVMAAWISRYCDGGEPLYTYTDEEIGELQTAYPHLTDLYARDIFGVSGTQKSVDYTLQGFPEVGEIPYGCVWTARGEIVSDEETGTYDILWTKAERLTSGRRDANRIEIASAENAGFVIVWQEDPEGLRPGQGLGPGEGWSGAVVNQKTDIWYSYIGWQDFDLVEANDESTIILAEYLDDTQPKIVVPMAMPVRITDNDMCKPVNDDPYCYYDFDQGPVVSGSEWEEPTEPSSESDYCSDSYLWTKPDGISTMTVCVAEDSRIMTGQTGASRPRIGMYSYTLDDGGTPDILDDDVTSAWVLFAAEESKGLGYLIDENEEAIEIGKNMWYYTFDMSQPTYVEQGLMLNQPATLDPETGEPFEVLIDEFGNELYNTEIARRFSLVAQSAAKADASQSQTTAFLLYKQGIINQGGPADIFARRLVLQDEFDVRVDNPYAYENMLCDEWLVDPTSEGETPANINYIHGVCNSPAINLSGTSIVACDNNLGDCAEDFPWEGGTQDFPKVTEWVQTGPDFVDQSGPGEVTDWGNLDDQSWENPYDVAKGHRGFLDGDFLMVMYAWAPNWKANTVGNDHYNLYVRRSFDGGQTFTTLPANFIASDTFEYSGDGTSFDENYGVGGNFTTVTLSFGAGQFEQARNVSLLTGNKITILDPRYTPTSGLAQVKIEDLLELGVEIEEDDAVRDPSKFFIVYETGDNTTVAEGEAVPLDLFYSRGYDFGDDYDLVDYYKDKDGDGTDELVSEWDWLENKQDDLSGEAGVTANPAGTFFYAVWNQWQESEEEVITNSDDIFRRVMYLDDTDSIPTSSLLFVSAYAIELEDDLTLVGTARDNDHLGDGPDIVEYAWYVDDSTIPAFTGKDWKFRVTNMKPGFHSFGFSGKDNEGNWSQRSTVTIMVVEELHTVSMPLMNK